MRRISLAFQGTLYFRDGQRFDGVFEAGQRHGMGKWTAADGTKEILSFGHDIELAASKGRHALLSILDSFACCRSGRDCALRGAVDRCVPGQNACLDGWQHCWRRCI